MIMKWLCKISIVVFILVICAVNCTLPPYSQSRIMKRSRQMLADSGDYYLGKWLVRDRRVSIDSLVRICSPNISQFDSVRGAIFNTIAEINDTAVLQLMSIKVVSGNPIEKLIASAYIYRYYGIEMKVGQDIPLASLLVLFHTTADKLKNTNSPLYRCIEHKREFVKTFPKSESLYREFILNSDLTHSVRVWFVESLLETADREMVTAFLMDLETELNERDPISNVTTDAIYTLMIRGAGGNWLAP